MIIISLDFSSRCLLFSILDFFDSFHVHVSNNIVGDSTSNDTLYGTNAAIAHDEFLAHL